MSALTFDIYPFANRAFRKRLENISYRSLMCVLLVQSYAPKRIYYVHSVILSFSRGRYEHDTAHVILHEP